MALLDGRFVVVHAEPGSTAGFDLQARRVIVDSAISGTGPYALEYERLEEDRAACMRRPGISKSLFRRPACSEGRIDKGRRF